MVMVVVEIVVVAAGVLVYYLTLALVSLMVYTDSKVTNCSARLNETVMLHVKNIGTVDSCQRMRDRPVWWFQ